MVLGSNLSMNHPFLWRTLSETTFFQAYRNWLTVIDMIAMPEVAVVGTNTIPECSVMSDSLCHLTRGKTWTNSSRCNSSISHSPLTPPVRHTFTSWSMHAWMLFYP